MRRMYSTQLPAPAELTFQEYLAAMAMPARADGSWVRSVFVSSVDGAATGPDGRSGSLSTTNDATLFLHQRQLADVIVVGAGTARNEHYGPVKAKADAASARAERGQRPAPVLCLVSSRLDLDPADPIFTDSEERVVVATHSASDWSRVDEIGEVADVVRTPGEAVDLTAALAVLAERGLHRVVCEGGPSLHGEMIRQGVIDELLLTVAPVLVGGGSAPRISAGPHPAAAARPMELVDLVRDDDGTLFQRWQRPEDQATSGR
jgi:riboflavin biosynthesis pyrimidine reductase